MSAEADALAGAGSPGAPARLAGPAWRDDADPELGELLRERAELLRTNEALSAALRELSAIYEATLSILATTIDLRDREADGHSRRVAAYTVRLAREVGVHEPRELDELRRAALLHDIGKAGISDQILLKPGRLNEQEWRIVRTHPVLGYRMLRRTPRLERAAELAYTHHERWDGTGYPRGLRGEAIPMGARLFAVADVFDALTSDRPYRTAIDLEQAAAEIARGRGSHFDPQVVDAFLRVPLPEWAQIRRGLIA
ncbi:HD-GYP domain-containing protein [Limnochorda pilosa]|uniref:Phosphohydrolase n=1 Tax=Limnochorda pilosa TaxID=1555112 RepID=A0A0K2SHQ4_LIMPI|nr:HD-GYP domain-containing protein [Limnochorda pilosa]BAS26567.1 phosphohydrolase [Limnochorda pilosa]